MEILENCCIAKKVCQKPPTNPQGRPANVKCVKRYVQPPRAENFRPHLKYCPPQTPIEGKTVYCTSFYSDKTPPRPKPFEPRHNLEMARGAISKETTTNLSFQPVCGSYKAKPIIPRSRLHPNSGKFETTTTVRSSYVPKYSARLQPVVPCGQIVVAKGSIENKTTMCLSYLAPGHVEQLGSFKPQMKYCKPEVPIPSETTQKLSYLPVQLAKKENYPWGRKPIYKPPEIPITCDTTYKKSYFENDNQKREQPVRHPDNGVLPAGAVFDEGTIYRDSFLPCPLEKVGPVMPSPNLKLSKKKMTGCTTNKLSFQPVKGERRRPILPRSRKMMMGNEKINIVTTTQMSFTEKHGERAEKIVPCGQIQKYDGPLEGKTTTALSYLSPGNVDQYGSFKPNLTYCKPQDKVATETVNMLSYQQWNIGPKEELPWARKPIYKRPETKMPGETVTHMSFPTPGYYVEECYEDDRQDCGDHC